MAEFQIVGIADSDGDGTLELKELCALTAEEVLACLGLTDANTVFEYIGGEAPAAGSETPPAAPTDDDGDTAQQWYDDAVICWESDGAAWIAPPVAKPLPKGCCPGTDPSGANNPPTDGVPPGQNADGTTTNPWIVVDPSDNTITDLYVWNDGIWWHLKSCCPVAPIIIAHTPAVIGEPDEAAILADATAAAAGQPPTTLIKVDVAPTDCRYTYRVEADGTLCLIEEPQNEFYVTTARSVGSNYFYGSVVNLDDITPVVCVTVPNKTCKTYFAKIELGVHAEIHPRSPVGAVGVQAMLSLNGGTTYSNVAHNITSNEAASIDTLVDSWNDYAQRIAIPPGGRQFCFKGISLEDGTINDDAYTNLPIIEFQAVGGHNSC